MLIIRSESMKKWDIKKNRKYYLAILFVIVLVLLPTHQANAGWLDWGFEKVFANVLFIVFTLVGKVIGVLAVLLNWVIHFRVYPDGGIPVVDESWKIMRNFANMFFILALIIMAFATIFNITKYEARTLFPKFLISALLINFSLVLGVLVIDASQVVTNTFLVAIGDMSLRLGQELNPSQLLPSSGQVSAAVSVDSAVFGSLVSLLFAVVLLFTFLFSLLTAAIFAIIRIPILWALLVVSPIAWILNVFPAGQGTYKKWWSLFIGWNMFLPIFLFFLYFGLYFLQSQDDIIQKIAADISSAKPTSDWPFSFQLLFMYVLAAIFLIGGTICAMKASMFSGTGVVTVAKWSRGVAARRLGLTAAGTAAKERIGEIQKEGLPGRLGVLYGGEAGLQKQTDVFRRAFGVRGGFQAQQDFVALMNKESAKIKDDETAGRIQINEGFKSKAFAENSNSPRGAAMRAILYERGMMESTEFEKDMTGWTQNNPFLAQKMSELAKKGKYKNIKPTELLQMAAGEGRYSKFKTPGATTSRKEWFNFLKEDDRALTQMTLDQYGVAIDLMGGPKTNDAAEFRKAIVKKRPDLAVEYDIGQDIKSKKIRDDDPRINEIRKRARFYKEIRTKSARDLSQMADKAWQNQGFQEGLKMKIENLDRSDPPVKQGAELPDGTKAKKSKAAGGTVFQNTLRKSVGGDYKKLKIARNLRPISDFDDSLPEAGGEAPAEGAKKEEPKT